MTKEASDEWETEMTAKVIRLRPRERTDISRIFTNGEFYLSANDLIRWMSNSDVDEEWRDPIVEALRLLRDRPAPKKGKNL